jgi:hypothetical protein
LAALHEPLQSRLDRILARPAGQHRTKLTGSKCAIRVGEDQLEHDRLNVTSIDRRGPSRRTRLPRPSDRRRRCLPSFYEFGELLADGRRLRLERNEPPG